MSGITFNTSYKKKPQQKIILYNIAKPIQVPVQVPVQVPDVKKSVVLSNSNISITDKIKEQYLKKNIIT